MYFMDTKLRNGDIFYAMWERTLRLLVKRSVDKIYFCEGESEPDKELRFYVERGLTMEPLPKT